MPLNAKALRLSGTLFRRGFRKGRHPKLRAVSVWVSHCHFLLTGHMSHVIACSSCIVRTKRDLLWKTRMSYRTRHSEFALVEGAHRRGPGFTADPLSAVSAEDSGEVVARPKIETGRAEGRKTKGILGTKIAFKCLEASNSYDLPQTDGSFPDGSLD